MSSGSVDQVDEHVGPADDHGGHAGHPSEAQYVKIALLLAAITAAEVGLFYTKFSQALTNATLLVMAAVKFIVVAAYFMHLKFDSKILRRLFITGFVLATFCYIAYLLTLGVFQ